jgi:hypothetical protein
MKKIKILFPAILVLMLVETVAAQTVSTGMISARSAICVVLFNIRQLLAFIAASVATLVITLQGVKWIGSAEDPGARKQAKAGIIHAVVGLIIVMSAIWIVRMVFTGETCDYL